MDTTFTKLFNSSGYISAKEYVEDIVHMKKLGLWNLPLGIGDRVQIHILSLFIKVSWFSNLLYIIYPQIWSPSYNILISFLIKHNIFDFVSEKNEPYPEYFSFFLVKNIHGPNGVVRLMGQGIAKDKFTALSKAIGEMIERSISGLYDNNSNVLKISVYELMKKCSVFYPPKYHRFLDIQKHKYKDLCNSVTDTLEWVEGINLITKNKVYIPKQITSWFGNVASSERVLVSPTSNGCAGYFTQEGATLRGLLEVIHRDALLCHWLTKTTPSRIIEKSLPEHIQKTVKMFVSRGVSIYILDITAMPIPSVCIVAITEHADVPLVALSVASALTLSDAIQNALEEMVSCSEFFYHKQSHSELNINKIKDKLFIFSLDKEGRQRYWMGEEKIRQLKWFISGKDVSYEDVCKYDLNSGINDSDRLNICLETLKNLGEDYFPVVYYPNNSIQKNINFYISQVYIPKAFPLYLFERYGTFDSDRLHEFAISKNNKNWNLNQEPHMFS